MNLRASIAVSLLSTLALASLPARASYTDYESMLNGFLGRGSIDNHTQSVVQNNINTRQGQIEQEIAAGIASGQLTPDEAADVKAQLDGVANMQGQYLAQTGGKLNNIQIQNLVNELTSVTTKLQAYLTNTNTVGSGTPRHDRWFNQYGGQTGYSYNQMANGHIDSYQAELLSSIQQALTSGKISVATAQSLRGQLNQTDADQARMTAGGRLSREDSQRLMTSLDALKLRINQEIANGQRWSNGGGHHYGWGQPNNQLQTQAVYGQSMLKQRIYDGLKSGKLSRSEADGLFQSEHRIQDIDSKLNMPGNRLSWSDQRRMLSERDQLTADINSALTNHHSW